MLSRLNVFRRVSGRIAPSKDVARRKSTQAVDDARIRGKGGLVARALDELQSIREAGTYKIERILTSPQSTGVKVKVLPKKDNNAEKSQDENVVTVLNFCSNNYLGLSNDPRLVEAAHEALDNRGFGLSSVRFICGTQDIHRQLERTISEFHGTEDTILYPSCFDANAGIFEALLGPEDAVISDALNHASLIDGIRLCKAQRHRYKHSDMADLERILEQTYETARNRLIVTDGVFSMDGDVAKLNEICDLAETWDAEVLIDDCHATGILGRTGRGTPEHCGVGSRVDIINSTLGKALGGATGGYSSGPRAIIDLLRQRSRPYLFSNTLAPFVVGASLKTFSILNESSEQVEKLARNVAMFRTQMTQAGFDLAGDPNTAIAPVMLGDARLASEFADDMLSSGVYVIGFSYPVVPKGAARIRVQLSAAHSEDEIQKAIDAFVEVGKKRGVI